MDIFLSAEVSQLSFLRLFSINRIFEGAEPEKLSTFLKLFHSVQS